MRFLLLLASVSLMSSIHAAPPAATPPLFQRVDHLTLPVTDLTKARWFYGEVLGLKEETHPDKGVWYVLNNSLLHLSLANPSSDHSGGQLAFWASNVYRAAQVLEDAGSPIEWDELSAGGVERFTTRDPFGNILEVEGRDLGR